MSHRYKVGEVLCWHQLHCRIQIISQKETDSGRSSFYEARIISIDHGKGTGTPGPSFKEGQVVGCEEVYMFRPPMEPLDILKEML